MPLLLRKSSTNRRRYPRQPGPPDPRSIDLQIRRITTHLLRGATQVKSNDRRRYSLRRRSSSLGSERMVFSSMSKNPRYQCIRPGSVPNQSTIHHLSSSNDSSQQTQPIITQELHASVSSQKAEPVIAKKQYTPLAESGLPETTTAGSIQMTSHTMPVGRQHRVDAHHLSPPPPNLLTYRPPRQPAHAAVEVSCERPGSVNDSMVVPPRPLLASGSPLSQLRGGTSHIVLAQQTHDPGNSRATRNGTSNLPHATRCSACDRPHTPLSQRPAVRQPPAAARFQLPAAQRAADPQPKATLQLPITPRAAFQFPTANQLETDSQSAILDKGGVLRQTGNLEDVRGAPQMSRPSVSPENTPSPFVLSRDYIPENLPDRLNLNHSSARRLAITSPTLTRAEPHRGTEVPGYSTVSPANILLSPTLSYGSILGRLPSLNHNPASGLAVTSPISSSGPGMPPRFRSIHPLPLLPPLTTTPDSPAQPQLAVANAPEFHNRKAIVKKERVFPDGSGSTIWYQTSSDDPISSPPTIPGNQDGNIFVNKHRAGVQVWVMSTQWVMATEGHTHPLLRQRRLGVRSSGEPTWLTVRSYHVQKSKRTVRAKGPATTTTVIEM